MKYTHKLTQPGDFNLDHIFDCGQCFRWEKQPDGSYTGIAFGRVVNMQVTHEQSQQQSQLELQQQSQPESQLELQQQSQPELIPSDSYLIIDNCTPDEFETIWRPYLDLDRDYSKIKAQFSAADPTIRQAINYGNGIRILKQDLWETLVSFIISQNNNIPRIKGCINNLSAAFGTSAGTYPNQTAGTSSSREYFNIPTPEVLAALTIEDLAPIKLGYRARYLIETAAAVIRFGLPQNLDQLSALCGVGPKVANCVSLFGLNNLDCFPIDVWVRRVMNQLYGIDEKDVKAMAAFAADTFGQYGGIAQQYLFYYMRSVGA